VKQKIAIVIAALFVASMASVISTSTVSATHTQAATIDATLLPSSTAKVLTITVTNNGPDAIDNVRIVLPSGFTSPMATATIPADTKVQLAGVDNKIVLPAGTMLRITGATTVTLPADTVVIRLAGENIRVENTAGTATENRILVDNLHLAKSTAQDVTGLIAGDNVNLASSQTVTVDNLFVVLVADAVVTRSGDNFVLNADTTIKVAQDTNVTGLGAIDNVTTINDLTGKAVSPMHWITQSAVATTIGVDTYTLAVGAWVDLRTADAHENEVFLPAGSTVNLAGATTVKILENTQATRTVDNAVTGAATVDNRPLNWMQAVYGNTIEYNGIGDNNLASGSNLAFPFQATTPGTSSSYSIFVRATDTAGATVVTEIVVSVDATAPTVTATIAPSYVKANTQVTITVKASEALAKLDNVMVHEANGENTRITMTSTDSITWTGRYTTGDNNLRDGTAHVWVVAAQTEDLAGNALAASYENTFTIDRMAPRAPQLENALEITSWITDSANTPAPGKQTTEASWLVEGYVKDNVQGVLQTESGMIVKIRVGSAIYTLSPSASGYFYQSITLSEGLQQVGIYYIDKAGNVGPENYENVFLDSVAPVIHITSPSAEYIRDNTPLIVVALSDTGGLGIENTGFTNTNNSGYTIQLRRDNDNLVLAVLTPRNAIPGPFTSANFENQWSSDNALPDLKYNVYVIAGDNLENALTKYSFTIDTIAPTAPAALVGSVTNGTVAAPTATTSPAFTLTGTGEADAVIKVYTTIDGGVTWTLLTAAQTTVSSSGSWSTSVPLTGSAGETTGVAVTATDVAGNESGRTVYGYLKYTPAPAGNLAGSVTAGASASTAAVTKTNSVAISGTASPNTTIKVYTTTDGGVTWTVYAAGETAATSSGAWTTTVDLAGFAGDRLGIAVTSSDSAGNESARTLYGYVLYDPTAPAVSITAPASGTSTDASSIEVRGTVTKDAWESYSDVTLTLQVGTGSVIVPIASDGSFVYSVALSEGLNTIVARASDGVNLGAPVTVTVTRTVTPWATYAIIIVIIALILAAIAIFRRR